MGSRGRGPATLRGGPTKDELLTLPSRYGFSIVALRHGATAICSCGWQSGRHASAGLAGSAWDLHEAEAHAEVAEEPAAPPADA